MVIVDPHPLPMSPGAAAAAGVPGTAGVVATAGASRVQRPEKSAGGCAATAAGRTAANQSARSDSTRISSALPRLDRRHARAGERQPHQVLAPNYFAREDVLDLVDDLFPHRGLIDLPEQVR